MSSTTIFHDMTGVHVNLIDGGFADGDTVTWAGVRATDSGGTAVTIVLKTATQATQLINAGIDALAMLTGEDGGAS